jgi:hypothetical protein
MQLCQPDNLILVSAVAVAVDASRLWQNTALLLDMYQGWAVLGLVMGGLSYCMLASHRHGRVYCACAYMCVDAALQFCPTGVFELHQV